MLYSLSDFQCQLSMLFFVQHFAMIFYGTLVGCLDGSGVQGSRDVQKSCSSQSFKCELLIVMSELFKKTPLVITESTEPANGSDNSKGSICTVSIELDNS